jgi:alpha-maltose-1-phosphate synthase
MENKMIKEKIRKIAIITPDYPPNIIGGAGISCELMVKNLRKIGRNIDVFAFHSKVNYSNTKVIDKENQDFYIKTPNNIYFLQLYVFLKMLFKIRKYQIIHVYNVTPLPAISLLNLIYGNKKLIFSTLNNHNLSCANTGFALKTGCDNCNNSRSFKCYKMKNKNTILSFFKNIIFIISKKSVSKNVIFVALTENIVNRYKIAGFNKQKYVIIPNAIDNDFELKIKEVKKLKKSEEKIILFVGQFNSRKGPLDLIQAYEMLSNDLKKIYKLVMIGSGKDLSKMQEYIKNSNLNVEIIKVEYGDLAIYYANAEVFVHPALWLEPFSRTWLEAIIAELPILSSDNPSAIDILKNGALYYKHGNIFDLSNKLSQILTDNKIRDNLVMNNKKAKIEFRENLIYKKLNENYDRYWSEHNE